MADRTMRVTGEEDNADAQNGSTKRVVEDLSTRRVGDDISSTAGAAEVTSRRDSPPLPLGVLAPGSTICGDCIVIRTLYPHESQRPGLYLCQAPEGEVIVKVAATMFPPKPELWQRLTFLRHPNVLRTFRTLEQGGLYFDVQEYCNGGTLAERVPQPGSGRPATTPEWIERNFLRQINDALKYLHSQDIVHRDIKPANVYIHQENGQERYILADFDISSVLEQTRTSRDTQRAAGTWIYTAPEAFPRFIDDRASGRSGRVSRSSDYYSLGVTIIELLLGTTSLHLCQLPDLFDFYLQGGRVEIPKGIPGRLSVLLRGLLMHNRRTRWTADEVERWLNGQTSDQDLQVVQDDEYYELARANRPYKIGAQVAVDLPSLAEVMFTEQEIATEDLITSDILLNWIGNVDPNIAREIRRDRDKHYLTPTLVLHYAIQRCDPTRPFIFPDKTEAKTTTEWITAAINIAGRIGQRPEEFCTTAMLHQLQAWLRFKEDPMSELADGVAGIEKSPARVRLEELAYLFQAERPYPITRTLAARSPKELVALTYGPADGWKGKKRPACYEASYQRWFDQALCAWLRQRGLASLADQCDQIREAQADEPFAAFETILRLLDPALEPVPVSFDQAELNQIRTVPYGQQRSFTLHYFTDGPGTPFGAITCTNPTPSVQLDEYVIRQREGTVNITIDTQLDRQAAQGITYFMLRLESGIAKFCQDPVKFRYRIDYPTEVTVRRVFSGIGLGMLLIGLPR
ncbi:MAG TPA: protein kinase, partial [Armatimonadota bacterium]|nr:protein kinase [Armatimonadota bacterium]